MPLGTHELPVFKVRKCMLLYRMIVYMPHKRFLYIDHDETLLTACTKFPHYSRIFIFDIIANKVHKYTYYTTRVHATTLIIRSSVQVCNPRAYVICKSPSVQNSSKTGTSLEICVRETRYPGKHASL